MRIFISADMEGCTGVVCRAQVLRDSAEYRGALRLLHSDVNAAVEGAFRAGAAEVVVNDAHDSMMNLSPAELDPRASLISGAGKPLSMVEGIEGAAAALFVGYHARAGAPGAVLEHTYSSRCLYRLEINGREVGETAMNAGLAGHFGVPVALLTGDAALMREATADVPWAVTVAVKEGLGPGAADCLGMAAAAAAIREGTARALAGVRSWTAKEREARLVVFAPPVTFALELVTAGMAALAERCPGARRTAARRRKAGRPNRDPRRSRCGG